MNLAPDASARRAGYRFCKGSALESQLFFLASCAIRSARCLRIWRADGWNALRNIIVTTAGTLVVAADGRRSLMVRIFTATQGRLTNHHPAKPRVVDGTLPRSAFQVLPDGALGRAFR